MRSKTRFTVILILILICFLIQTTMLPYIALGSITPNLLIIVTSSIGFMRGKKEGLITGFICGLMIDVLYSDIMGYQAFLYMIIGYCNGYFQRLFYDDDIKLPLVLIGTSELLYGMIIFVCSFLLRSRFDFFAYFYQIIIPELIYTLLVTLILYQIIRKVNHSLETYEKGRESKFV